MKHYLVQGYITGRRKLKHSYDLFDDGNGFHQVLTLIFAVFKPWLSCSSFFTKRSNPSIWQCRVESKSADLEVNTTAHLTIDPPSEFISVKLDGESPSDICDIGNLVSRYGIIYPPSLMAAINIGVFNKIYCIFMQKYRHFCQFCWYFLNYPGISLPSPCGPKCCYQILL